MKDSCKSLVLKDFCGPGPPKSLIVNDLWNSLGHKKTPAFPKGEGLFVGLAFLIRKVHPRSTRQVLLRPRYRSIPQ